MRNSIYNCTILELPKIHNRSGNLTSIGAEEEIPFPIKRIYYLYDVPGGEARGGHAHKNLKQLIVAMSGSFDIKIDDGINNRTYSLNRPYIGLLITSGIWRELDNFSSGAICTVFASEKYDEQDYIRDYVEFQNHIKFSEENKVIHDTKL